MLDNRVEREDNLLGFRDLDWIDNYNLEISGMKESKSEHVQFASMRLVAYQKR